MFDCAPAAVCRTHKKPRGLRVSFGGTEHVEIEHVSGANRKPDSSHDLSYQHPYERAMLLSSAEEEIAKLRAISWHEIICAEYGLKVKTRRSALDQGVQLHKPNVSHDIRENVPVASAVYEPGVRKWLVDTGCPFDLIAEGELDDHETSFIKKATKSVTMSTPNGIVDANKSVSFRVPVLGSPIEAYVMKHTPTVMTIGTRCMTLLKLLAQLFLQESKGDSFF